MDLFFTITNFGITKSNFTITPVTVNLTVTGVNKENDFTVKLFHGKLFFLQQKNLKHKLSFWKRIFCKFHARINSLKANFSTSMIFSLPKISIHAQRNQITKEKIKFKANFNYKWFFKSQINETLIYTRFRNFTMTDYPQPIIYTLVSPLFTFHHYWLTTTELFTLLLSITVVHPHLRLSKYNDSLLLIISARLNFLAAV